MRCLEICSLGIGRQWRDREVGGGPLEEASIGLDRLGVDVQAPTGSLTVRYHRAMQNVLDQGSGGVVADCRGRPSGDQIAMELHRLGVRHLSWARDTSPAGLTPTSLLIELAMSPDARLRDALVPLFILQPGLADAVLPAADQLVGRPRVHLVCAYSAAVVLQSVHGPRIIGQSDSPRTLPDSFGDELDIPATLSPEARLAAIGARHAGLSGEDIDWCGTYRHAVDACLRFAETMPE